MTVTKAEFDALILEKDFTTKSIRIETPKTVDIVEYFINGEKVANVATPINEQPIYQIV